MLSSLPKLVIDRREFLYREELSLVEQLDVERLWHWWELRVSRIRTMKMKSVGSGVVVVC